MFQTGCPRKTCEARGEKEQDSEAAKPGVIARHTGVIARHKAIIGNNSQSPYFGKGPRAVQNALKRIIHREEHGAAKPQPNQAD
jgi:hypothetical protein